MRLDLLIRFGVGLSLLAVVTPISAESASAYPCTEVAGRAGNLASNVSVADGVVAVLKTPASGELTGVATNRPSGADVYLQGSGGYVQAGWYVGSINGSLPYTATPRMWWGDGDSTDEVLHAGIGLSWDTYYQFQVSKFTGSNEYAVYIQNSYKGSTRSRTSLGRPGFIGEVNFLCTRMEARAFHASDPRRTLMYRYGGWSYWDSGRFSRSPEFVSTSFGDIATNLSYGGGS